MIFTKTYEKKKEEAFSFRGRYFVEVSVMYLLVCNFFQSVIPNLMIILPLKTLFKIAVPCLVFD